MLNPLDHHLNACHDDLTLSSPSSCISVFLTNASFDENLQGDTRRRSIMHRVPATVLAEAYLSHISWFFSHINLNLA